MQAGAGTGKTTTLIARVAHALQKARRLSDRRGSRDRNARRALPQPAPKHGAEALVGHSAVGRHTPAITRPPACAQRVNPRCILVLTYTNKMAGEARQRLARQGLAGAERVTCSTVHALCLRILRDNWR